jgi:hypothetical protein
MMKLSVLSASLLATQALAVRKYSIVNSCPAAINLYINGESQGSLAANGGTTVKEYPNTWSGFIYTDANGGNQNGAGTTRAGFYGEVHIASWVTFPSLTPIRVQSNYYYIVVDPQGFNTAVSISPVERAPVSFAFLSLKHFSLISSQK